MGYLFQDKDLTLKIVKGVYKKFKAKIFYDKTLLFTKKKIAEFEYNGESFLGSLNLIAAALTNLNTDYFDSFIEKINFNVLPKRFESVRSSDVVYGSTDHNQILKNINFFIDMPIELHIVDFLWTLLIGKIMNSYSSDYFHVAATKFNKGLFLKSESLDEGIDFDSNRAFMPYFKLYSKWRNGAFNIINKKYKDNNLLLICLDLKSFYYSVDFNFDDLRSLLHEDERLDTFEFLTDIIRKIYKSYTDLIIQYKEGIRIKPCSCIFPIGLDSSIVLREIYMVQFDKNISKTLNPLYYQRYVDDMLIVLNDDKDTENSNNEVLINNFVLTGLSELNDDELRFIEYPSLRVQNKKANCFYFHKGQKATLLDVYRELIKNSSEANLLPDISMLNASFTSTAYNIENLDISDKLRDLGFILSNNYKATRYLSDFQRLIKNTVVEEEMKNKFFDQVEDFYQGSQCLEYSNNWRCLFELYFLCKLQVRGRKYYKQCKDLISNISFDSLDPDEVLKNTSEALLKKLKLDLSEKLDISISLAGALDYSVLKKSRLIEMAKQLRTVNMLNHKLISYPLINYMRDENVSLTEINLSLFAEDNDCSFELDKFKLEWSPRFIHASEFFIVDFLHNFSREATSRNLNDIIKKFVTYNNLYKNNYEIDTQFSTLENVHIVRTVVNKEKNKDHRVAVVNTKINELNVLDYLDAPNKALTLNAKLNLYKILNTAKEGCAEFLVFPEFYLPIAWILELADFCFKNNITIITGLQYATIKDRAFNIICTLTPYVFNKTFTIGLLQFREKNFYAPKEKIALSKKGFKCFDKEMPLYYINNSNGYRFSSILCYEFTDICSRAAMKSNVELLFVPQLNHDTNYFSSIVESAARDLHCFVIQANTSEYGDSRITAPYKTIEKNILQIKGGETDVVMIGTVEIEELLNYRNKYNATLTNSIKQCFECNKTKRQTAQQGVQTCKGCKKITVSEGKIKPLPPQF